jgi:predicted transposase/invertase (TIGR01784 family)
MEGKIEGRMEGIVEGKIETAKQLKALNVAIEIIEQATGLSAAQIAAL